MMNDFHYETIDHPIYKYRLTKAYVHELAFKVPLVSTPWVSLLPHRCLVVEKGYCWDGLSGSPFEVEHSQEGSLAHDALCQLLNRGRIPYRPYRRYADKEMRRVWLRSGVSRIMADIMYLLVRCYAIQKGGI